MFEIFSSILASGSDSSARDPLSASFSSDANWITVEVKCASTTRKLIRTLITNGSTMVVRFKMMTSTVAVAVAMEIDWIINVSTRALVQKSYYAVWTVTKRECF